MKGKAVSSLKGQPFFLSLMDLFTTLGFLLGTSWTSGINLYLTVSVLGIAHRAQWMALPGGLEILSHPIVIVICILIFAIEFVADKVPYVDSAWDSFHTFIRPAGAAIMGYMAVSGVDPAWQYGAGLLTGSVALSSHLTKATARVAINTSPEPVTNSVASVTEDASVLGVLYLVAKHPVWAALIAISFICFAVWFLVKMFKFLKRVLQGSKKDKIDADRKTI